jgi:methionine-rich copper-binding protein CopC
MMTMSTTTLRRVLPALLLSVAVWLVPAASASAHDEIESSDPPSGAVLDEPIDEVTINFGAPVAVRDMRMYTDDFDDPLPVEFEVLSPTSVRVEFDMLSEPDTYILRYVADEADTAETEAHLLAGAISFTYGSPSDSALSDTLTTVLPWAIIVLLVGAFLSFRRSRQQVAALRDAPVD